MMTREEAEAIHDWEWPVRIRPAPSGIQTVPLALSRLGKIKRAVSYDPPRPAKGGFPYYRSKA